MAARPVRWHAGADLRPHDRWIAAAAHTHPEPGRGRRARCGWARGCHACGRCRHQPRTQRQRVSKATSGATCWCSGLSRGAAAERGEEELHPHRRRQRQRHGRTCRGRARSRGGASGSSLNHVPHEVEIEIEIEIDAEVVEDQPITHARHRVPSHRRMRGPQLRPDLVVASPMISKLRTQARWSVGSPRNASRLTPTVADSRDAASSAMCRRYSRGAKDILSYARWRSEPVLPTARGAPLHQPLQHGPQVLRLTARRSPHAAITAHRTS